MLFVTYFRYEIIRYCILGPHFPCWVLGVVLFNTWLISSWDKNKCCYKLSNWQNDNYLHSKWQLWPFWVKSMSFCAFAQPKKSGPNSLDPCTNSETTNSEFLQIFRQLKQGLQVRFVYLLLLICQKQSDWLKHSRT